MEKYIVPLAEAKYLPSPKDAIEILYTFKITSPDNKEDTRKIKMSISGTHAISWGYDVWREPEYYNDLIKILFLFAKNDIEQRLKDGTLKDYEEIAIYAPNHSSGRPYNPDELPEPIGQTIEVPIKATV